MHQYTVHHERPNSDGVPSITKPAFLYNAIAAASAGSAWQIEIIMLSIGPGFASLTDSPIHINLVGRHKLKYFIVVSLKMTY
jgi:hypothetical protein